MKSGLQKYFPVSLNLRNRPVLVVGAGSVGSRKIQSLLNTGAHIRVVAPKGSRRVQVWTRKQRIVWYRRKFRSSDLRSIWAVIGATSDTKTNSRIYLEATKKKILVNIVDKPEQCTFIVPSVLRRGDLTIAISTSGSSPALSRAIRLDLESTYGPQYANFLAFMKGLRPLARKYLTTPQDRRVYFDKIIGGSFRSLVNRKKKKEARAKALQLLRRMKTQELHG